MAFGLFKRNVAADTIIMGGKIYTQDLNLPWAEAVACKDGKIIAVGDYEALKDFEGRNTEFIYLENGIMLPGYIDTCGHPVMNAFADSCLYLKPGNLEYTLAQISEYASQKRESRIIFAYGYNENILNDMEPKETRECLDKISNDKPIVILGMSGLHCWFNTFALEVVKAAAIEDEIDTVSLQYLLSVLEPIDFDTMPERVPYDMQKYSKRGFTSVFDCGAPEFFASIYQNMMISLFHEKMIKQRFYGSLLINRDADPRMVIHKLKQYKTNCIELDGLINFNTLKLIVDRTQDQNFLSSTFLKDICMEAGDKGFNVHVDAIGKKAVFETIDAMESVISAGYKKSSFTIAHDETLTPEELINTSFRQEIKESPGTIYKSDIDWLCIQNVNSIEMAIDILTIDGAIQLGIDNDYGSIEKGKRADFAVFNDNPFDLENLSDFKDLQAVMTIIEGKIVYNALESE
ncbi:MAG: amidohydrolase family protein [Anaerovoracaceae bacterium]|jgi:predicted amidohydrolase YtcJ|nr:amidohydrolase family protein [Clostridiales bacterium]